MNNTESDSFFPPKVIKASAGSGKTWSITNRYLSLLLKGERAEKILATTFTRKAAAEISHRVFNRIATALVNEEDFDALRAALKMPNLTKKELQITLKHLVTTLNRLNISTLDSFFTKIAKSFCLDLGLSSSFSIADQAERSERIEQGVHLLCQKIGYKDLAKIIGELKNADGYRSVHEIMVRELPFLKKLVEESTENAWRPLAISTDPPLELLNKAIVEIENFDIPLTQKDVPNKNWESAIKKILDTIYSKEWEKFIALGFVVSALQPGKQTYYNVRIPDQLSNALKQIEEFSLAQKIKDLNGQLKARYFLGTQFSDIYNELLLKSQRFQFDELKDLLKKATFFEDLSTVYYRLDTQIKHLLLDEFQDTAGSEWYVLQPMIDEILSKGYGEHSFFCVGDVKQAIYGWRGGLAEIFDTLTTNWPHLEKDTLELSYRSSAEVIATVNFVFENLHLVPSLNLFSDTVATWQRDYLTHATARTDLSGYVELTSFSLDSDNEHDSVFLHTALRIKEILQKNCYKEIAVLVRSNQSISQMIFHLSDLGIEVSEEGGNPIVKSIAVNSILALLRYLDHPGDTLSLYQLIISPLGKKLGFTADSSKDELQIIAAKLKTNIYELGFGDTINKWCSLILNDYRFSESAYLKKLGELSYQFEPRLRSRFTHFINSLEGIKVESANSATVKVMTIHQSKGLEFDCVVLPDLDFKIIDPTKTPQLIAEREDPLGPPIRIWPRLSKDWHYLFPDIEAAKFKYDSATLKESLSLLYVALTRARRGLYMFYEEPKRGFSNAMPSYSSMLFHTLVGETLKSYTKGSNPLEHQGSNPINSNEHGDFRAYLNPPQKVALLDSDVALRGTMVVLPSQLSGGGIIKLANLFSEEARVRRERGTAIHSYLEKIGWLSDDNCSDIPKFVTSLLDFTAATVGQYSSSELNEIQKIIVAALQNREIQSLYKKESYIKFASDLSLYSEYRFAILADNKIISGSIDRLIIGRDKDKNVFAEIIDIKSGGISMQNPIEHYKPQLLCYKEAVQKMFKLSPEQIFLKLLFVDKCSVYEF